MTSPTCTSLKYFFFQISFVYQCKEGAIKRMRNAVDCVVSVDVGGSNTERRAVEA